VIPGFAPQVPGPQLEEDVNPVDPVVFFEAPEEKELSMAARVVKAAQEKAAAGSVKVKVNEPYRVLLDGKAYTGGDVLEIPLDEEHKIWLKSGWVQPVKEK
jgi:hypothetical protein